MNPIMTNEEFSAAFASLPFHHAPEGYWDAINEQRKKHKFVGRKAFIDGKLLECVRAEDDLVIFKLSENAELIISRDDVCGIKWLKKEA